MHRIHCALSWHVPLLTMGNAECMGELSTITAF